MKASDLRLGNIVSYLGNTTIVTGISVGHISTLSSGVLSENQIIPILLTEEYLLKFGFKKLDGVNFHINKGYNAYKITDYKKDGFALSIGVPSNFGTEFISIVLKIKYIHQLQNLYFALTGEELIIKDY